MKIQTIHGMLKNGRSIAQRREAVEAHGLTVAVDERERTGDAHHPDRGDQCVDRRPRSRGTRSSLRRRGRCRSRAGPTRAAAFPFTNDSAKITVTSAVAPPTERSNWPAIRSIVAGHAMIPTTDEAIRMLMKLSRLKKYGVFSEKKTISAVRTTISAADSGTRAAIRRTRLPRGDLRGGGRRRRRGRGLRVRHALAARLGEEAARRDRRRPRARRRRAPRAITSVRSATWTTSS